MKTSRTRWIRGMGAVMLVGGLLILGTGNEVTQAGERDGDHNQRNPFHQILDKLDQILAAIKGGEGQDGNHTLRWDTNNPSASRFIVLTAFNNQAVLDKNTGLVWEKSPTTTAATQEQWVLARVTCATIQTVGGQKGWRLPSMPELSSLVDPSVAPPGPTLPPGHPFLNVQSNYWSATMNAENPTVAWLVDFGTGNVSSAGKTNIFQVLCVRGGMNADQY